MLRLRVRVEGDQDADAVHDAQPPQRAQHHAGEAHLGRGRLRIGDRVRVRVRLGVRVTVKVRVRVRASVRVRARARVRASASRLEALDAIGASQRCKAHLKHEQAGAVDVELAWLG